MSVQSDITKDAEWFTGTDIQLVFPIYERDGTTPIAESMVGWEWSWLFKRFIDDDDADALITKTGADVFLAPHPETSVPSIFVQVAAEDSEDLEFSGRQTVISGRHELKRIDDGSESVYSFGKAKLRRAVHAAA